MVDGSSLSFVLAVALLSVGATGLFVTPDAQGHACVAPGTGECGGQCDKNNHFHVDNNNSCVSVKINSVVDEVVSPTRS